MADLYHLAELNIARLVAPIDDPRIADFVNQIDGINSLAETSPGFIWRLQTESGNATDIQAEEVDDDVIVNMSVWRDVKSLRDYVYHSNHLSVLKRKADWFSPYRQPHLVLWWVPAGHEPGVSEAMARLDYLTHHGPGARAFAINSARPAPFALSVSREALSGVSDEYALCATDQTRQRDVLALLEHCGLDTVDLTQGDWEHGCGAWFLHVEDSTGKVVASGAVEPADDAGLLRSIAVTPDVRGLGVARALVSRLEFLARQRRMQRLYLLTETAPAFFRAIGYREIERTRVPRAVSALRQFAELCPDTAVCLSRELE